MRGSDTFNGPVVYDVWRVRRDLLMEIWLLHKAGGMVEKEKHVAERPLGGATS